LTREFGGFEEPVINPSDDVLLATRRRLKHDLTCVRGGLSRDPAKGVRALASTSASPARVDELDKQLESLLKVLDQNNIQPPQLRQTIQNGVRAMTGLLAGGPKSAPAAAASSPATPAADLTDSPF
jgi:hypothetical protein